MKDIEKDLAAYYQQNLAQFGSNAKGVGWKNTEAQTVRFDQLAKIFNDRQQFSVNDLGCGVGDFMGYLTRQGFAGFRYAGYDMLQEMVDQASENYGADQNASFTKVSGAAGLQPADYTVASGIFNLKYNLPEYEWLNIILESIHFMDRASRKGFAFNVLTKYSDKEYMQDHLYYADPLFLFDFCKRNYSRNVALLHDYNEYDFTILVRK